MGSWSAIIVETNGRTDFWDVARAHRVEPLTADVPRYARIDTWTFDIDSFFPLGAALTRDLASDAAAFFGHSGTGTFVACAYTGGELVRHLRYSDESDGWTVREGAPQPWERAAFLAKPIVRPLEAPGPWPDVLWDDISDDDIARYEAARVTGDVSAVFDLIHPHSLSVVYRIAETFGIDGVDPPHARWRKPSWLERLWGRRRVVTLPRTP